MFDVNDILQGGQQMFEFCLDFDCQSGTHRWPSLHVQFSLNLASNHVFLYPHPKVGHTIPPRLQMTSPSTSTVNKCPPPLPPPPPDS